jgi:hypothetical protein
MNNLLAEMSTEEHEAGRGLITAVVVRSDGGGPGRDFYRLATVLGYQILDETTFWARMVERVHLEHAITRPGG